NMIHMIRQIIDNDEKFRQILRGLNKKFYHQTVTSRQIEDYINKQSGINFDKVFEQYLTTTQIPVLESTTENGRLLYRWNNSLPGFAMPVKVYDTANNLVWIYPTEIFKKAPENVTSIKIDENFYVNTKNL
ncbi:MAG: M1 family peptidase, partial [Ginsengibacter sp.]